MRSPFRTRSAPYAPQTPKARPLGPPEARISGTSQTARSLQEGPPAQGRRTPEMAQLIERDAATPGRLLRAPEKSVKILAKSLFRELRSNGYDDRQIVALSTELISLLTTDIKE